MSLFFIRARNSKFCSRDEGAEYDRPEAALTSGVQSAITLMADEINQGEQSASVEISVEQEDGTQVLCSVVTISVSALILDPWNAEAGQGTSRQSWVQGRNPGVARQRLSLVSGSVPNWWSA